MATMMPFNGKRLQYGQLKMAIDQRRGNLEFLNLQFVVLSNLTKLLEKMLLNFLR